MNPPLFSDYPQDPRSWTQIPRTLAFMAGAGLLLLAFLLATDPKPPATAPSMGVTLLMAVSGAVLVAASLLYPRRRPAIATDVPVTERDLNALALHLAQVGWTDRFRQARIGGSPLKYREAVDLLDRLHQEDVRAARSQSGL